MYNLFNPLKEYKMEDKKKFTWADLKKAVNELPEDQLNDTVIIWGDEIALQITSIQALEEDYLRDDEGCTPRSALQDHLDENPQDIEEFPVVLKKGTFIISTFYDNI